MGSAKPSQGILKKYSYHLIDFLEPNNIFSAGDFAENADRLIEKSWENCELPIIVGGTGFYIRALLEGLAAFPGIGPKIARKINPGNMDPEQRASVYSLLRQIDPKWAEKISSRDTQRILRAWEVVLLTGKPMSHYLNQGEGIKYRKNVDLHYWILDIPKGELNKKIESRSAQMISMGLVEETKNLLIRGAKADSMPMKSVGYRQVVEYLNGTIKENELILKINIATRQYAKRQRTWFRRESGIRLTGGGEIQEARKNFLIVVKKWNCKNKS